MTPGTQHGSICQAAEDCHPRLALRRYAAPGLLVHAWPDILVLGKSSLTVQYCEGHFVESYYPTIENTFSHEIVHKGQTFLTEIIDTAGQVSLVQP